MSFIRASLDLNSIKIKQEFLTCNILFKNYVNTFTIYNTISLKICDTERLSVIIS